MSHCPCNDVDGGVLQVSSSWSQKRHKMILQGCWNETMYAGRNDICHFRHRYVGVILYPRSQAEDIIGNCMAPVIEKLIFAYFWWSLSDEDLSVVREVSLCLCLADCKAHHFWAGKHKICLSLKLVQTVLDILGALHGKMSSCVCEAISLCAHRWGWMHCF